MFSEVFRDFNKVKTTSPDKYEEEDKLWQRLT